MTELFTTGGVSLRVWDTAGRMVFGPPETSPAPAEPTLPQGNLARRVIAGDTWYTGRVTTGRTGPKTYLSEHNVYASASALQLTYGGQLPAGVSMELAASIQLQGQPATRKVATFNGSPVATLTGPTQLVTDDIPLKVAEGDIIEVLTYYGARSDGREHPAAPGGWYGAEILNGNQVAGGNPRVGSSRDYDGGTGYRPAMPSLITGMAEASTISWLIAGDSITESGSPGYTPVGSRASITSAYTYSTAAAKGAGVPWSNIGYWASRYPATGRAGHWAAIPALEGFTHVTTAWGYNDVNQATATKATVERVMADAVATWKWMKEENSSLKIWQTTLSPNSTSTDGWKTLEGQQPVASADMRRAFNAWVRDGAPLVGGVPVSAGTAGALRAGQEGHPLAGYVEVADTVMSARDSEIFRVDHGALTADGGHPNSIGHSLMRAPMDALVASWKQV